MFLPFSKEEEIKERLKFTLFWFILLLGHRLLSDDFWFSLLSCHCWCTFHTWLIVHNWYIYLTMYMMKKQIHKQRIACWSIPRFRTVFIHFKICIRYAENGSYEAFVVVLCGHFINLRFMQNLYWMKTEWDNLSLSTLKLKTSSARCLCIDFICIAMSFYHPHTEVRTLLHFFNSCGMGLGWHHPKRVHYNPDAGQKAAQKLEVYWNS